MKGGSTSFVVRELPITTTMKYTTCILEGPNPKNRYYQFLVRMWSDIYSHSLMVGMQTGTATLIGCFAVSYRAEYSLTIKSNCASRYLPNWLEKLCLCRKPAHEYLAILTIITKNWEQPRYLQLTNELTNCGTSI